MDNLSTATSSSNLWNNVYQVPEGSNDYDAEIDKFNQYCNMITFNNGFQVSPQLRATAMQMQSFMNAMKQHGVSQADFYNFAKASLPILQREYEKVSLCSVKIDENQFNRRQKRELMLNKISGTQLNLTNYSTQASIFASKTLPFTARLADKNNMSDERLTSNLEKMGLAHIGTTVLNYLSDGLSGWFDEVASNVERHAKAICYKNPQIKGKCQMALNVGPEFRGFISEKLQKMAPLVSGFEHFPSKAIINTSAGMNDPMFLASGAITQEDAFLGAMVELHAASTVVKVVGHVFVEGAKAVCSVHPNIKSFCKGTLDVAGKFVKTSAEWTGLKEPIKSGLSYIKTLDGSSIAEILIQQGMPQEQALALSKQTAADMKIVGFSMIPLGTIGTLAKRGFSLGVGSIGQIVKKSSILSNNAVKINFASIKTTFQKFAKDESGWIKFPTLFSNKFTKNTVEKAQALKATYLPKETIEKATTVNAKTISSKNGPPYVLRSEAEEIAAQQGYAIAINKRKIAERGLALKDRDTAIKVAEILQKEKRRLGLIGLESKIAQKQKKMHAAKQDNLILQNVPDLKNMPLEFLNLSYDFTKNFTQKGYLVYQEVGKDILFFIPSVAHLNSSLGKVIESALAYATTKNKNRIFMSWDPLTHSMASVVKAQSKEIIAVGKLSRGEGIFPLNVIEIVSSSAQKTLTTAVKTTEIAVSTLAKKNSVMSSAMPRAPILSVKAKIKKFAKDECGAGKLPIERDFIVELFEKIGYAKVPGGKGSHEKWRKANCKMVIIPQGKNGELSRGTVNNLMKTYDDAINQSILVPSLPSTKQTAKLSDAFVGNKPLPHRIDYSQSYLQAKQDFVSPKEFNGFLSKDLYVVQFHGSGPLGQGRSHKWFMPVNQGNKLLTIDEVKDSIAKLTAYGEISQVTLAKIPAGDPVRFLHGKAKEKIDLVTNERRAGGGVQYRFFDFDPNWIVQTRKLR